MKRVFSRTGMIAGVCLIVLGILSMTGVLGGASSYGSYYSPYDSGFASFGADYYTYSVNNSAQTANAARTTASNLVAISEFLELCFGLFFVLFGTIVLCGFGIAYADCDKVIKGETKDLSEESAIVKSDV